MKRIIYQDEEPKNWRKIKFFVTLFVILLAFTMIGFLAYLCFKTTEVPIAQASEPEQIDYCGLDAVICEDEYLPPIKVETPYKSNSSPTEANKGDIQAIIIAECRANGVNEELALNIARRESEFNPNAKNKNSSASGVYQFINSSWIAYSKMAGQGGQSVFNAEANIKTAIWVMKNKGTYPWGI